MNTFLQGNIRNIVVAELARLNGNTPTKVGNYLS